MSNNIFMQYVQDAKKYPLLTAQEEILLANKIKNGCKKSLEKMINSNLRLVIKVAKKYSSNYCELMDIIQEGNMGLITAAKKYSPEFNIRFSFYACFWIRQAINRYLPYSGKTIYLPVRKYALLRGIRRFIIEYKNDKGKEPSFSEIADYFAVNKKHVYQLRNFIYGNIGSLDAVVNEETCSSLYDYVVADENIYNPEKIYIRKEINTQIDKILDMFDGREKDIMLSRYCLNGGVKAVPLHKLGSKYGISAESVRKIELKVLMKLRTKKKMILDAVPF